MLQGRKGKQRSVCKDREIADDKSIFDACYAYQRRKPRVVLDFVHVLSAQSGGGVAHEGHHEAHALRAQTSHDLVRNVEKLRGRKKYSSKRAV